jgi:hypothetical protein
MKKILKNKKILNDWYEFSLIDNKNKLANKFIANKNFKVIHSDAQWGQKKLLSVIIKNISVNKNGESMEFENFMIINENNEVILENVKSISTIERNNNIHIIEFDTRTINLKKHDLKKNERLFCIINNEGKIIYEPTITEIKYSPYIDTILIGDKNFTENKNQDSYDSIEEVVKDNTYLVNKGKRHGLLFGNAFWDNSVKSWRKHVFFHWLEDKYDDIEFYQTSTRDCYIVKLNDLYKFYYIERGLGSQNEFFGNKYKKIKKVFNKALYLNMGFLCFKEDGMIDYVYGFKNLNDLKTSDESEALQMVYSMILNKNITYESLYHNFPDTF